MSDFINGLFELFGAFFCYLNVIKIKQDKKIEGVDWRASGFFTAWGVWNLYYYPNLNQIFSTIGALGIVSANSLWLYYVWKFRQ